MRAREMKQNQPGWTWTYWNNKEQFVECMFPPVDKAVS